MTVLDHAVSAEPETHYLRSLAVCPDSRVQLTLVPAKCDQIPWRHAGTYPQLPTPLSR